VRGTRCAVHGPHMVPHMVPYMPTRCAVQWVPDAPYSGYPMRRTWVPDAPHVYREPTYRNGVAPRVEGVEAGAPRRVALQAVLKSMHTGGDAQ
jgi:hypothetical protein